MREVWYYIKLDVKDSVLTYVMLFVNLWRMVK